ncbi:MAG: hypothetical protein K0R71_758 [Bacillales bacterium]|jgi:small acid-soluble spore protein I (minor)|nr:hypothetical protein [Bacillales bacterium]
MDLNIRQAIYDNIRGNSQSQFQDVIEDAMKSGEEKMLPGLGVLFELVWKHSDHDVKTQILETLAKNSGK